MLKTGESAGTPSNSRVAKLNIKSVGYEIALKVFAAHGNILLSMYSVFKTQMCMTQRTSRVNQSGVAVTAVISVPPNGRDHTAVLTASY